MKRANRAAITLSIVLLSCFGCQPNPKKINAINSENIPIDSTFDAVTNSAYARYLLPKKSRLDSLMNETIGYNDVSLVARKPESTLSNWAADVTRQVGSSLTNTFVDVAIVNMGGLRSEIPQGPIMRRHIYELMPFENELTVLTLKGTDLIDLCDAIAKTGGQGVSGLRMTIKGEKAVGVTVNGKPIDPRKSYRVATSDYLAEGNDQLTPLMHYIGREDAGVTMRTMFMQYVETQTASGKHITASVDNRMVVAN